MCAVGEAHARGVLQRHPAARVNRLRLAEHERQLLAFGHRRLQPLQARGRRRGVIGDHHLARLIRRFDGEFATEGLVGRRQGELQRRQAALAIVCLYLRNAQLARIQHQLLGGFVLPLQRVGGSAADLLGIEIQLQVQRQVLDDHQLRLGVGTFVVVAGICFHGSLGSGGRRGGGYRRRGVIGTAGQRDGHGQGQRQEREAHRRHRSKENWAF